MAAEEQPMLVDQRDDASSSSSEGELPLEVVAMLLRRLPLVARRCGKTRGGGGGSFFAEGKHEPGGNLFGESPLPPGQSRKWESWEGPWYFTFGAATAMLAIGLSARPDSSLSNWADRKAAERLGS